MKAYLDLNQGPISPELSLFPAVTFSGVGN